MQTDYTYEGAELFFKHETTKNMPKDAYSTHSHNMYELLYFVGGDATHVIEDRKYVKPKPQTEGKKGYVCKVCGWVYEGDPLPEDIVCPLCKHGAADFEPIQ